MRWAEKEKEHADKKEFFIDPIHGLVNDIDNYSQ